MATQTSLAMAGARVAGIPPVNVPGLINPPVRKKGFIGAISSSGQSVHFFIGKLLLREKILKINVQEGKLAQCYKNIVFSFLQNIYFSFRKSRRSC